MNNTFYPKKSLGQNFLCDPNIIRKIVGVIAPQQGNTIVEIGPGNGALTDYLVGKCKELILIEKDEQLVQNLQVKYGSYEQVSIFHGDILTMEWQPFLPADKIVGNLPYNISSQILFAVYHHASHLREAIFMVQKEVALRLVAKPSTKEYGIMTVLTPLYGKAEILFHIPPTVFFPRPKVNSSLIKIYLTPDIHKDIEDKEFFHHLVRTAFNQRRKTLRNSLKTLIGTQQISDIDLGLRAEALSFEDFKRLYHHLKEN